MVFLLANVVLLLMEGFFMTIVFVLSYLSAHVGIKNLNEAEHLLLVIKVLELSSSLEDFS
jgi:hypothetical protein